MPKLLLVVDDERDIQEIVRLALAKDGLKVEAAKNGAAALEKIASMKPDLIVLDLMLPMLSGLDILAQMKKGGSSIPVIVLTALGADSQSRKDAGGYANVAAVLGKPVSPDDLRARVLEILARSGQAGR